MRRMIVGMMVMMMLLVGCADYNASKGVWGSGIGAGVGAIAGQAIGRSTEGTLIGAAAGGLLGYIIGNEIDKYDKMRMEQTWETGRSGQPVAWVNPDTGSRYSMTPHRAYERGGQVCRDADIDAVVEGRRQSLKTTACRDDYGHWRI